MGLTSRFRFTGTRIPADQIKLVMQAVDRLAVDYRLAYPVAFAFGYETIGG